MFIVKIPHFSAVSALCLCLCGCVASNPIARGEVARYASERWIPPCRQERICFPMLPTEVVVQEEWNAHEGPWAIGDLVDIALRNNPLTHESWQSARATAYTWKASQSTLYPTVGLTEQLLFQKVTGSSIGNIDASTEVIDINNANATGSGGSGSSGVSGSNYNQWVISTLSSSYLLLDFGGRFSSIESARQGLLSANWTHNRNIQAVILLVLTNYYAHLEARALFSAKEEDIKNARENLNAAQGQFAAGVKAKLDVLLSKSNLANTELELEKLRGLVKITLGRLATSLGIPANIEFSVQSLPEDVEMEKINKGIEDLIAIAQIERPDLASSEADWRQARENAVTARSAGLPTLTANGNVQVSNNIHHSNLNSRQYTGFLQLNVPIFTGYFHINQTRTALAAADELFAVWKDREQNVVLDVVTSYYDYKTALETVKFSEEYLKYTEEAYEVAFASYKSGIGTILDLLAAQGALSNARAQKIQARTQWITSLTNVAYATGQL